MVESGNVKCIMYLKKRDGVNCYVFLTSFFFWNSSTVAPNHHLLCYWWFATYCFQLVSTMVRENEVEFTNNKREYEINEDCFLLFSAHINSVCGRHSVALRVCFISVFPWPLCADGLTVFNWWNFQSNSSCYLGSTLSVRFGLFKNHTSFSSLFSSTPQSSDPHDP